MPDLDDMTPGQVLADAEIATFIEKMGMAIATAQTALDRNSVNQAALFAQPQDGLDGRSLFDIGLSPPFYHYQHADVAVTLQISLRAQEDTGVDLNLNGQFNDAGTSNDSTSSSSSSSSSGSTSRTSHREARVQVAMSTQGALTVGGNNYQLEGPDPQARINALAARLRGDSASGVERALPVRQGCTPVNPTVVPEHSKVVVTPNSVAFLSESAFKKGFIRISDIPSGTETWRLKTGVQVDVEPGSTLLEHARNVQAAIQGLGYTVHLLGGPDGHIQVLLHDIDEAEFDRHDEHGARQYGSMRSMAGQVAASGMRLDIHGYTSRTASESYNQRLGLQRAQYTADFLKRQGVPEDQIVNVVSHGETRWNVDDNTEIAEHRLVRILETGREDWLLIVVGDATHDIVRAQASPEHFSDPLAAENGFFYLHAPQVQALDGSSRRVDVNGHSFPVDGTAIGGHVEHSGEAYARNLADDINGESGVGVHASARGNIVHLCPEGARYEMILLTRENREIEMSGTDDVTVTSQFSRSQRRDVSRQRTGNQTVAFGGSLDVRHQRQFERTVNGNSSISARIVSVPAPAEFLATIKDYLS